MAFVLFAATVAADGTSSPNGCHTPAKIRVPFAKPSREELAKRQFDDVAIIKFSDGTGIRFRNGEFAVVESELEPDRTARRGLTRALIETQLALLNNAMQRNGAHTERLLISTSEETLREMRCTGESRTDEELPDLNLFYRTRFSGKSAADVVGVLHALNQLELVEYATPEVKVAPSPATDISPPTANYAGYQSYFQQAPGGIDVQFARALPGGRGEGVRVVVVEKGWEADHEDFPPLVSTSGYNYTRGTDPGLGFDIFRTHGTAVVGMLGAVENGYGITGISPAVEISMSSIVLDAAGRNSLADGIARAQNQCGIGDILLLEQQVFYNYPDDVSLCPPEWDAAAFSAIATAVAGGRIVIETAGNGTENLDDATRFGSRFNRAITDSGAIYVGAGHPVTHVPRSDSNYGSRLDVQGWGDNVATLGYGDLFYPASDYRQAYTSTFNSTSAAAPIVTGAAAILQSVRHARGLASLTSPQMRAALLVGATPQGAGGHIGPLPDLRDALAAIPVPAPGILATGSANGSATISWNAVPAVAGYEVFRKDAHGAAWALVHNTATGTSFVNGGLTAGATYLFRVRAYDATGTRSADSNYELATTIDYADPLLTTSTLVRAKHIVEVRKAVNAVCVFAGSTICPAPPFTAGNVDEAQVATQPIRASDFAAVENQLVSLRSAIGAAPATFRDTAGVGTSVTRIKMEDLRTGAK